MCLNYLKQGCQNDFTSWVTFCSLVGQTSESPLSVSLNLFKSSFKAKLKIIRKNLQFQRDVNVLQLIVKKQEVFCHLVVYLLHD